jgi:hypothetical protein
MGVGKWALAKSLYGQKSEARPTTRQRASFSQLSPLLLILGVLLCVAYVTPLLAAGISTYRKDGLIGVLDMRCDVRSLTPHCTELDPEGSGLDIDLGEFAFDFDGS